MTGPHDFEDELRDRLQDATSNIVAGRDLQRRLLAAAANGNRTAWGRVFRATWALPAAAAAVTHGTAVNTPALVSPGPVAPTLTLATVGSVTTAPPTRSASHSSTPTSPPSTHHSSSAPTRPPSTARSVQLPALPALCTTPAGGSTAPTTVRGFTAKILGTWRVCSKPSAFAHDDAGLLIDKDGTWARLVWNSSGKLGYASGPNSRGTWKVIDDSAMNGHPAFQVNFQVPGGGTFIMSAQFAAAVNRMHLNNNGEFEADYVSTSLPVVKG